MPVLLIVQHGQPTRRQPYSRYDSLLRGIERYAKRLLKADWTVISTPDGGFIAHSPEPGEASLHVHPENPRRPL